MSIAFWIVAGLTAVAFFAVGAMKLARPVSALKESGMGWIDDFSTPAVKLIALAEVVGAIGLVLPPLTGLATILSPVAGLCLALLMAGAIAVHRRRKEAMAPAIVQMALALGATILGFINS